MKSYQQFFAELKRRRVFRVMAVYGIVGFVVLQIVDLVVPALLLPDWSYRLVALFLLVGFPVAIVLTWAFESTPAGFRRTEHATDEEMAVILAQPASRRWSAGLLAMAGAALLFGGWWIGRAGGADPDLDVPAATAEPRDIKRIAVLPFANVRGDEDSEVLAWGLQEGLAQKLRGLAALRVTSTGSVHEYRASEKSETQIADELGIGYLVRGTVLRAGERVQVNVSLVDGGSGETLWSDSFDEDISPTTLFAIQSGIAVDVTREVGAMLGPADVVALKGGPPTDNLAALNAYNRARDAAGARRLTLSLHEAIEWARRATELDSSFVAAWGLLARLEAHQARTGDADMSRARAATLKTEALAPGSADAIIARAFYTYYAENRFAEALSQMEAAALLAPSDGSVRHAIASLHRRLDQLPEAIAAFRNAIEVDPRDPGLLLGYSHTLEVIGRLEAAEAVSERALEVGSFVSGPRVHRVGLLLDRSGSVAPARAMAVALGLEPTDVLATELLVRLAVYERDIEEALRLADQIPEQTSAWDRKNRLWAQAWPRALKGEIAPAIGDSLRELFEEGAAPGLAEYADALGHAAAGDERQAVAAIDEAVRLKVTSGDYWSSLVFVESSIVIRALLGRVEQALDLLEGTVEAPSHLSATDLRLDPTFDPLRANPRFDALVARRQAYEAEQDRIAEAERPWLP